MVSGCHDTASSYHIVGLTLVWVIVALVKHQRPIGLLAVPGQARPRIVFKLFAQGEDKKQGGDLRRIIIVVKSAHGTGERIPGKKSSRNDLAMPLINIWRLDLDIASDYKLLLLPLKKLRPKTHNRFHRAN